MWGLEGKVKKIKKKEFESKVDPKMPANTIELNFLTQTNSIVKVNQQNIVKMG